MKLMIAGSRGIKSFDISPYVPEEVELIICGGAAGIDAIAEDFADQNKISKLVIYPNYKRYGRYAPLKRNDKMVEIADEILVVWDGDSRGSEYTIKLAEKSGKKLTVVKV